MSGQDTVAAGGAGERPYDHVRLTELLRAGRPLLWVHRPAEGQGHGPGLVVRGWALALGGIEGVTVEVGRRKQEALLGLPRPDIRAVFPDAANADSCGFLLATGTEDWPTGTRTVKVTVRTPGGEHVSLSREVEIAEGEPSLDGYEKIVHAAATGRAALWVERPALDGSEPVGEEFVLRGSASHRAGIASVSVGIEGLDPQPARLELDTGAAVDLPSSAVPPTSFGLGFEAAGWPPGRRAVTVAARAADGETVTVTGHLDVDPDERYRRWREETGAPAAIAAGGGAVVRFAVVVLAGEGGEAAARRTLDSIRVQTYERWQLLLDPGLVDDGAPPDTRPRLEPEPGARFAHGEDGPVAAALQGLSGTGQAYCLFLAAGDLLAPEALARLAAAATAGEHPAVLYPDEDVLDADGLRRAPWLKPGWSPELLEECDYIGPVAAFDARAARVLTAAGSGPGTVREALLGLVEESLPALRVPEVLCSRPPGPPRAQASRLPFPGGSERPLVSVVIPTSGRQPLLAACLRALRERTAWPSLEVVLVGGDGGELPTGELGEISCEVISAPAEPFNFSAACNLGATRARGRHIVFLNDDTEAVTPEWVERLVELVERPGVAVAGAKLLFPGGLVQHAGVLVGGRGRLPRHLGALMPADAPGYRGLLGVTRNCSAVTAACLMVGAEQLEQLGGFDDGFVLEYGDVDLCLRAIDAGGRVAWSPRAVLVHHERATRAAGHREDDAERLLARWGERYADGDPFYHPGLSPDGDFELA